MNDEKVDNQLNMALDINENVRAETTDLNVGYDEDSNTWELIIKYNGDLSIIENELNIIVTRLLNGYAIIIIKENLIEKLSNYEQIEFIEKPKKLNFALNNAKSAACITIMQNQPYNLTGEGILVSIIDSGIDYSHFDFRNSDGTTRILYLWDQTINDERYRPPKGYNTGVLFTKEDIDKALEFNTRQQRFEIVGSRDVSGHGTHVAGIACGNGNASNGTYKGVAIRSNMIVVKLGSTIGNSFPRTTRLMEAIDFSIKKAIDLKIPIAINISFGNNYGAHNGNSLLEQYINSVANVWKNNICIGTGNEGSRSNHVEGILKDNDEIIELSISEYEFSISLQIWKNFFDEFDIYLVSPFGKQVLITPVTNVQRSRLDNTYIYSYYGEPSPYNMLQEIYIEFIPVQNYIDSGLWRIVLKPRQIVTGDYNIWLPVAETINPSTRFLNPSTNTTLTIPSTSFRAISVAGYNSLTDSYADFSGRGYTSNGMIKPDIAAPAVDITAAAVGGGYTSKTGTSMATPFVTGSCALMMEWGIIQGNDEYLYGEKMKAYLIRGAKRLPGFEQFPNPLVGYGALCLRDSLPR